MFALVVLVASLVADAVPRDRLSLLFVGGLVGLTLWELASVIWAAAAAQASASGATTASPGNGHGNGGNGAGHGGGNGEGNGHDK